jgi:hypothetical protein
MQFVLCTAYWQKWDQLFITESETQAIGIYLYFYIILYLINYEYSYDGMLVSLLCCIFYTSCVKNNLVWYLQLQVLIEPEWH